MDSNDVDITGFIMNNPSLGFKAGDFVRLDNGELHRVKSVEDDHYEITKQDITWDLVNAFKRLTKAIYKEYITMCRRGYSNVLYKVFYNAGSVEESLDNFLNIYHVCAGTFDVFGFINDKFKNRAIESMIYDSVIPVTGPLCDRITKFRDFNNSVEQMEWTLCTHSPFSDISENTLVMEFKGEKKNRSARGFLGRHARDDKGGKLQISFQNAFCIKERMSYKKVNGVFFDFYRWHDFDQGIAFSHFGDDVNYEKGKLLLSV